MGLYFEDFTPPAGIGSFFNSMFKPVKKVFGAGDPTVEELDDLMMKYDAPLLLHIDHSSADMTEAVDFYNITDPPHLMLLCDYDLLFSGRPTL